MLGMISAGLSVASGIKGLFSKSKAPKQPDIRKNIRDQAEGVRQAAALQGFNPLTMLAAAQPGGAGFNAGTSGPPPLASIEAITNGLAGIEDITSGDAARRRAADQLELDLGRLKLDQARSGVALPTPTVAYGVGSGPAPLGRRTVAVTDSNISVSRSAVGNSAASPSDPMVNPSVRPITMAGTSLRPSGHWSDTAPVEERYGEIAGELHGLPSYIWDMTDHLGKGARRAIDKRFGTSSATSARPPIKPGQSIPDGYGGFYSN